MQTSSILKKTNVRYPNQLPKAILFDWDNTLVDTWHVCFDSFNTALKAIGRQPITSQEFWNQPHLSTRDSRHRFGDHYEEWERVFYETISKRHLEELIAFEGAESLLKTLKEREVYVGIVSNKTGAILRKEVNHLKWEDYFHEVIGARDTEQDKPSHLPVLAALKPGMLCPKSHEVWFVGDSIVDVQCARASGCIPLVVGDGNASLEEDVIHVKDCHAITSLIESL